MRKAVIMLAPAAALWLMGGNCQSMNDPGSFGLPAPTNTSLDSDGDGITDADENNIYFTSPFNADSDFDELSDYDEVFVHGTNPVLSDTDLDGLLDGLELDPLFGSDPLIPDTDGDFFLDGQEIDLGLDLLLPNKRGVVSHVYCTDFIAVIVDGIEGVYERGFFSSGAFPSGFISGDGVAIGQPLSIDHRTGAVRANLRTGQRGSFSWEGDVTLGAGFITNAAPTTLSIRIFVSSGLSFEVNFLDVGEVGDWFIGDYVEIVSTPFALEMLNEDACEIVLLSP